MSSTKALREPESAGRGRPAPATRPRSGLAEIHHLQRVAGNRVVTAMLKRADSILEEDAPAARGPSGLPAPLRSGIEHLTGIAMDDVHVHYDSPEPARYQALAFARGTTIHLAPGQERHLPHEAWHTVQQKQGRVAARTRVAGAPVNDDPSLEREADAMGQRALGAAETVDRERLQRVALVDGTVFQPVWDSEVASDDEDHAEGDGAEYLIDWNEITPQGFQRLGDDVLGAIFFNLVKHHYAKLGATPDASKVAAWYTQWKSGGVYTRSRFKQLIGLNPGESDDTNTILQPARTGNTYSVQGGYTASSGTAYAFAVYYRDGDGNIAFGTDAKTTAKKYNDAGEKPAIDVTKVVWANPLKGSSTVQMNNDLTNARGGVMPHGTKVDLPKATRAQHFAIADMLLKIKATDRTGKWTWHHLSDKYKMLLVDMNVHAKHGHNGGVYLWK